MRSTLGRGRENMEEEAGDNLSSIHRSPAPCPKKLWHLKREGEYFDIFMVKFALLSDSPVGEDIEKVYVDRNHAS